MADENELYAEWLAADPANRGDVEQRLFAAVRRHVQAVLWGQLGEPAGDLVNETAVAVMMQLGTFRGESKFSTWVEGIARKKAKAYIRGRATSRKLFDEYTSVSEGTHDDYGNERIGEVTPSVSPQLDTQIGLQQLRDSIPEEDAALLKNKEEGLKSKDIAQETGTTAEAVDSRWARLKKKGRKFVWLRRK